MCSRQDAKNAKGSKRMSAEEIGTRGKDAEAYGWNRSGVVVKQFRTLR